ESLRQAFEVAAGRAVPLAALPMSQRAAMHAHRGRGLDLGDASQPAGRPDPAGHLFVEHALPLPCPGEIDPGKDGNESLARLQDTVTMRVRMARISRCRVCN